jgi:hypothetical protein
MNIERDWDKYHKQNKYSECQLITALNAKYYLTGYYISQDSDEYESLVDLCGARHGSAICIEKVWDKLNIEVKDTYLTALGWMSSLPPLPLELSVWYKAYGFHSVLAVDYESKTHAFRITNFKWATNLQGWIFNEDLFHYLVDNPDKSEPRYRYRLFGIKN